MPSHNRMIRVRFADGPAAILNIGAKEFCRELVFHFLDARPVGIPKEEPDHAIFEDAVDESIDNRPEPVFSAKFLEQTITHKLHN